MFFKKRALHTLLAVTLALPLPTLFTGTQAAYAEGPSDPAPFINAKVVNENAGKKVLFDNTHGQTAGAADWVIDGAFSDFGNGLAGAGYYVKELRKSTPITLDDLKAYDVFVIGEANIPYKASEQQAMVDYVKGGGSIFFVGDHYNADRNKNRWDASEVFNGYRRGAWDNPAKGMSAEEAASGAMQGVVSSDWLGNNFGVRFRYNALGDISANNVVPADQTFGITAGVSSIAMHAGSTMAILDPTKAKGLVYLPKTSDSWGNAVDQGVYNGGGVEEGPYAAISKLGLGKAAFIGDSSPVEDATPKYKREETGATKTTYAGWSEEHDAKFLVNLVNWLSKKESYSSFNQVAGLQLDQPTKLLPMEEPAASTEPQKEPWAAPAAGYKWWDPSTFKTGSYGAAGGVVNPPTGNPAYKSVHQAVLPNAEVFQVRLVADNLAPNSTVNGFTAGIYLTGGMQVAQVQNADGTWPTAYGYSSQFSLTADAAGHAYKDLTVRVKTGTSGAANLRFRQGSTNLFTEAVTLGNVAAEPLPKDGPEVPKTISIADARTKAENTVVTVEGVVTTKPGSFGGQAFYLQDGTAGIYVFQNTAGFQVGDKIKITASLALFNTELELTNPVAIEKLGTAAVPAPVVATSVNTNNQGQLVQLQNVTVQNLVTATPTGSFEFDAVGADGVTKIRVDARTGLNKDAFPYAVGQKLHITGAAAIFKGTYQLKPRGLQDFQVADATAPVSKLEVLNQPQQSGWYQEDVTVAITATDDSAVKGIYYTLNGGDVVEYTAPFTIASEGKTEVNFWAVDVNGNTEAAQSHWISLDKTAPTVSAAAVGTANDNGWYSEDVQVSFTTADNHSGVAGLQVKVGEADWATYYNTEAITVSQEGITTVSYRVTDNAGNTSELKNLTVSVDKTAPVVALTQSGTEVHDVQIDGTLSFELSASDAVSGVATQSLTLDDVEIASGSELSALSLGLGVHTVRATVVDNAGHVTEVSYTFLIGTNLSAVQNLLDTFAANGAVKNQGIERSIEAKLDSVVKAVAKGNQDQAVQHVQELIKTLSNYGKNGNVSAQAASVLVENLEYLLAHEVK